MPATRGWVRRFHTGPDGADVPAFVVFPHAGSGASAYRALSERLSKVADVLVLQYPGRQDRMAEPALGTIPEIASGAAPDVATELRGRKPILFGHSMGAIAAFETARLFEAAGIPVRRLAVSAAVPPSMVADLPPHPKTDEELLAHMAQLGGTEASVGADDTIMRMALPAMRADFGAFDAYSCEPGVTVAAPVTVLGGRDDPAVPVGRLHGWAGHTTAEADVTVFPGGHFYYNDQLDRFASVLTADLAEATA
ncbi:alpha/beta fold hydrolase [Tsukamurella sp. 8F]|uniref:thioesterase II family protein n=1 Tax=unclassified Tsukamurella TaxID=2633480 RepID=UPI0023B917D4|nr:MULTISPECIES: alpha/beta fold hydrolase [unclassified Tsukamurella]MDF0529310.1 alpha/beta fold hydrolase [Tsukamurella sp. 8J]MDF0587183.1 alpha/beta fold hydrolase [Tsukamurella sp. 8F]